jgi:hypothetical protein
MKNFWLIYAFFCPFLPVGANPSANATLSAHEFTKPTQSLLSSEFSLNAIPYFAQRGIANDIPMRVVPFYDRVGYEFKTDAGTWSLFDYERQTVYMRLDNNTIASYDNIIDDPFLALRTKVTGKEQHMHPKDSWENLAHFQALTPIAYNISLPRYDPSYEHKHVLNQSIEDPQNLSRSPSVLSVANPTDCFDHVIPHFVLKADAPCEKIWWQISPDANFAFVIPNFEEIQDFEETIYLDRLTDTFFNPNTDYFFRIKSLRDGVWSEWSSSYHFSVIKPTAVDNVSFQKLDDDVYEIIWNPSSQETRYHVFASNSRDFIPTIYYDRHINALYPDRMEFLLNDNLQTITTTSKIQIDGSYNYYRIIAEREGRYSIPSPLIYVYDTTPMPSRDILQLLPSGNTQRISFPPAYSTFSVKDVLLSDNHLTMSLPYTTISDEATLLQGYAPIPHIDSKIWDLVTPYLLPENHPIKAKLDRIFAERVTLNITTMHDAGFLTPRPRGFSKTVVSKHPDLEEYIVKGFLDDQKNISDWQKLMRRIRGAELIKKAIKHHHYESIFKVPQKWIYPLPLKPAPPAQYYRKDFILIAEDMHILNREDNYKVWKSSKMTQKKLDTIYTIIEELGLSDSVVAFNIPFVEGENKMAFIDTEIWHRWPITYKRLTPYLSSTMQSYWKKLIKNKGPKK